MNNHSELPTAMVMAPLASLLGHSYDSTAGAEEQADAVQTQFEELTLPLTYIDTIGWLTLNDLGNQTK